MKLRDALAQFDLQMQADGRSPHTRGNYRRHVEAFSAWLAKYGFSDELDRIRTETIAGFLTSPDAIGSAHGGNKTTVSLNAVRTSLRGFFGWLHAAGITSTNSARLVRRAICTPPPPRSLTDIELRRLEDVLIVEQGPVARRDHLLINVLLHSGIRLGSACALNVEDIDLDNQTLHLRSVKGDRPGARVFYGRTLQDHLVGYLANRPRSGPLFRAPQGERLSKRQAGKRVTHWFERAGIEATPHSLRHTFATKLLRKTGDLFLVRDALLHRSIASTQIYVSISDDRLRAALE
jgi:integrase/recombinase XerC